MEVLLQHYSTNIFFHRRLHSTLFEVRTLLKENVGFPTFFWVQGNRFKFIDDITGDPLTYVEKISQEFVHLDNVFLQVTIVRYRRVNFCKGILNFFPKFGKIGIIARLRYLFWVKIFLTFSQIISYSINSFNFYRTVIKIFCAETYHT